MKLNFLKKRKKKIIINLFNKKNKKKVLFSYSIYHFKKDMYYGHSNYQESRVIAETFDRLGYNVDIVNNNELTDLDINSYDVIFGEGLPLFQASKCTKPLKIYYGTGSYPWHCTFNSVIRLKQFQSKYGKKDFISGSRISPVEWNIGAALADHVICIGNDTTKNTFTENGCDSVFKINPTFYPRQDIKELLQNKNINGTRKNLLWFGSYGFIHKGLDLCIEAVRSKPDWTLHVCGKIDEEIDIIKQIKPPRNVIIHGFVDIMGEKYKQIVESCLFTILPSVSEGTTTSVINCMGNGGLIPIITKNCGIDLNPIEIKPSVYSIINNLKNIDLWSDEKLQKTSKTCFNYAFENFTIEKFRNNITEIILKLIQVENKSISE